VDGQIVRVVRKGTSVVEYDAERLEEALLSKHSQTAFLAVTPRVRDGVPRQPEPGELVTDFMGRLEWSQPWSHEAKAGQGGAG
jgi:hypothetical protein